MPWKPDTYAVPDGIAASPGLPFDSEPGTGFFRKSAGVVGVAINGAEVANFSSTGMGTPAGLGVSGPVQVATKSADFSVTAADSGKTFIVTAADKVASLPATAAGLRFRFVLAAGGLSTGTGLSISPVAADKIMGNGFTSADNKDAILAGSGDREGDTLDLIGDGVDGYYIVGAIGTWSRE